MDVKTVCLGMLTDGPASGYDLKKEFESTFAHFFAAGYGSIYPALSKLLEDGLLTCEEIPQAGKPDRKVYCITDEGRQVLLDALKNRTPCHKVRSEFLATMCFSHLMEPEDIQAVLDHRLEEIGKYETMFRSIEQDSISEWPEGAKFVLGFGKAVAQAMESYIHENRHALAEKPATKAAIA